MTYSGGDYNSESTGSIGTLNVAGDMAWEDNWGTIDQLKFDQNGDGKILITGNNLNLGLVAPLSAFEEPDGDFYDDDGDLTSLSSFESGNECCFCNFIAEFGAGDWEFALLLLQSLGDEYYLCDRCAEFFDAVENMGYDFRSFSDADWESLYSIYNGDSCFCDVVREFYEDDWDFLGVAEDMGYDLYEFFE